MGGEGRSGVRNFGTLPSAYDPLCVRGREHAASGTALVSWLYLLCGRAEFESKAGGLLFTMGLLPGLCI